jgi:hypothetical protein
MMTENIRALVTYRLEQIDDTRDQVFSAFF